MEIVKKMLYKYNTRINSENRKVIPKYVPIYRRQVYFTKALSMVC